MSYVPFPSPRKFRVYADLVSSVTPDWYFIRNISNNAGEVVFIKCVICICVVCLEVVGPNF